MNEDKTELEPCPFCGRKAYCKQGYAFCTNSKCYFWDEPVFSVTDWNNRPIEDKLKSKLEEMTQLYDAAYNVIQVKVTTIDNLKTRMQNGIDNTKEQSSEIECLTEQNRTIRLDRNKVSIDMHAQCMVLDDKNIEIDRLKIKINRILDQVQCNNDEINKTWTKEQN
ncbi:MAG: hypothetical protein J7L15_02615 [Clostridiales bacterium]|nr:hypothetical protein [Clostridiales bacterium]